MQIRKLTFAAIAGAAVLHLSWERLRAPRRSKPVISSSRERTSTRATPNGAKSVAEISPSRTREPRRTG